MRYGLSMSINMMMVLEILAEEEKIRSTKVIASNGKDLD